MFLVNIMQALLFRSLGVLYPLSSHKRRPFRLRGLVPVFKFQEPRGSEVDEALVVWSLEGK